MKTTDERWMERRTRALAAIIAMLLVVVAGPSRADLMTNDRLRQERFPAVILIEDGNGHKGYGVVVSGEGHVLTVAHVAGGGTPKLYGRAIPVDAPNDDKGEGLTFLGAGDGDIALLQFDNKKSPSGKVMPVELALPTKPSATQEMFRLITLSQSGTVARVAWVTTTYSAQAKSSTIELQGGGGKSGFSGAPIVDRYGRLLGLFSEGTLAGTFSMQLAGTAAGVLEKEKVKVEAGVVRPQPKTRIVVKLFTEIQTWDAFEKMVGPLKEALTTAGTYLSPEAELLDTEIWQNAVTPLFSGKSFDVRLSRFKAELNDPEMKGWFERESIGELYVFAVGVRANKIQMALVRIDNQIGSIEVDGSVEEILLKDPAKAVSVAIEKMRTLLKKQPSLVRNGKVLADCFSWVLLPDKKKVMNKVLHAAEFGSHLKSVWDEKGLAFEKLDINRCEQAYGRDDLVPQHLAEIMISVNLRTQGTEWVAYPTWDKRKTIPLKLVERPHGKTIADLDDADFRALMLELAGEVEKSSTDIINLVRP